MNKRLLIIFLFIFFGKNAMLAQQQDGTGIKLFFEKVYLHTDRNFYAGGDNIWFEAYLVNGQSNYPVSTSNTLYTELIDPFNKIISRQVIRIDSGVGIGDFKLDDSIAGGSYRIRAYTNWMRNFGNHFVFEKQLEVKAVTTENKKNEKHAKEAAVATALSPAYTIHFFPEGGSMLEGIRSVIAFKAEDANGKGAEASGAVLSASGDTVVRFKTTHAGMGKFEFTPAAGMQYKAWIKYPNNTSSLTELDAALKNGYAMKVDNNNGTAVVNIFTNAATAQLHPSGNITVAAKHGGRILYKEKIQLKDDHAELNIPLKDIPEGICSVTVYDEDLHPNCERLIYVSAAEPLNIKVTTLKNTYASKEKVTVNIMVTDAAQRPVKANISLAAIDDNIEKAGSENISTNLLLQTEVKGRIENAAAYFDVNNPQRLQQLDLLLMAQGWRDFLWRKMADTAIAIHYMPEQGISISGRIKQKFSQKPLQDMNISLQAPGAKGDKWYTTRSDAQGNYFLDGIPLYGVQTLKLNAANDKGEKMGELLMDSLFAHPMTVTNAAVPYDTAAYLHFAQDAAKRYTVEKNNKWFTVLPGVTVTTQKKTEFLRDGAYMSFGYPVDNFTITAADYGYDDLRNFLGKKVPGAYYDMENDGIYFMANGKKVRPRFVVDKREDVFDRIDYYSLPMQQVQSVTVRHMVGQPRFERTETFDGHVRDLGASPTDIFIITLVLKPGAGNMDPTKIMTEVNGYYQAKVFYAPNYAVDKDAADERTTIHWAPLITTDENGKASVSFYNADPKTTVRIDVQGVSSKGATIVAEKKYAVQ
ncbi:hypothetical protein [Ferruginibacter sp.]